MLIHIFDKKALLTYRQINKRVKPIFNRGINVVLREAVRNPIYTGFQIIDFRFPIACGQRFLIVGDRGTGKTSLAIGTILNQRLDNCELLNAIKKKNSANNFLIKNIIFCVYVSVAQRRNNTLRVYHTLKTAGSLYYTCMVSASATASAVIQYLAPYIGTTVGEFFMEHGHNVIVIYDDLSKHAVAYRQLSLLLKRPPARDAYPGDIWATVRLCDLI